MSKIEDKLNQLSPQQRAMLAKRLRNKRRPAAASGPDRHTVKLEIADRNERQPLSSAQQRLWFLQQLEPDSRAFHITSAVWLKGPIEKEILKKAFHHVTQRHEALRTTFHSENGIPFQCVTADPPESFTVKEDFILEVQPIVGEHHRGLFSLENGPLIRATLFVSRSEDQPRHLFAVTIHHIIADFGSINVLFQELRHAYESFQTGAQPSLPALPVQYIDYSLWERTWIHDEMRQGLLEYWQNQIKSAPHHLDFPTDYPRPRLSNENGRRFAFELPESHHADLQYICQSSGVTMFVLLQTAYAICLHQHSGQTDLVIGTVVANRSRSEFEKLIGFFANTLPLRFKFAPQMSVEQLLKTTRERSLELLDHQELSLDRLVEALNLDRHPNQSPIFQYTFDFLASAISDTGFPGVTIEPIDIEEAPTKYDLMLSMQDRGGTLRGAFIYNQSLFQPETIKRLTHRFEALLRGISSTNLRLEELPRMGDSERTLVNQVWSGQVPETNESAYTIVDLFEQQAQLRPQAIAVRQGAKQWSYQALSQRVNTLSASLEETKFAPETPIAVSLKRSLDLIAAPLAIMRSGGTYLPLDPSYPQERLEFMLEDSAARILITEKTLQSRFLQTTFKGRLLLTDSINEHYDSSGNPSLGSRRDIHPDQTAYLIYTSGSTGRPKGCMVSHAAYSNTFQQQREVFEVSPSDHVLQFANSSFDASVFESYMALLSGACLTLASESDIQDPTHFTRYINEQEITIATLPPSFLKTLKGAPIPSLRVLLTAGERADPELAVSYGKTSRSFNLYGPTEASVWSTFFEVTAETAAEFEIPIGIPIKNTSSFISNRTDNLCPIGIDGELLLGGRGLARGYLNRPDLTAERFIPDPYRGVAGSRLYRTGDLARWNAQGTLDYVGRNDRQVKIRGRRIEIGEIEWAAKRCSHVQQVAVVSISSPSQDARLILYWSPLQPNGSGDSNETTKQLKNFMIEQLPDYMIPSQFIQLKDIPLTLNGKVDLDRLPDPLKEQQINPSRGCDAIALDPITESIIPIWATLLSRTNLVPENDFFELGGHSLLAVQLASRVQEVFQIDLSVREVFEAPVLRDLSDLIRQRKTGAKPGDYNSNPIPKIPDAPRFPPSHSQRRLWFLQELEGLVAAYNLFGALRIKGDLDQETVSQAFQSIIARQESLRLGFASDADGEPYAFLRPNSLFQIQCIEAQKDSMERINKAINDRVAEPFDLTKDPLIRLTLIKCPRQETLLLVNMHHAISDGWSVEIFLREFAEIFSAAQGKRVPDLAPINVQFNDCSAWLSKRDSSSSVQYWTETLRGAPELLELPADHARPRRQSYRGGSFTTEISKELSVKIDHLCTTSAATTFTFFQSAYAILLSRLARQPDLVIGSVVANRPKKEMEPLVGFFANTLAYRFDLTGNPSFEDLLKQSKSAFLKSLPHHDAPFESVIDQLQPERNQAHSPIFQVMLVVQNIPAPVAALRSYDTGFHPIASQTSKFDLTLFVEPRDEGLRLRWEYASDLFEIETVERFSESFLTLLEQIVLHPNIPAGQLGMVSQREHQTQAAWNATAKDFQTDKTIIELFEEQAASHPNRIALQFEEKSLTYRQLDQRSNQLAHLLIQEGVQTEELVGVYAERSLELVIALYGIMKAGAAYVPIDPEYPAERIQYMIQDSGTRVLLTQEKLVAQSNTYLSDGKECSTIALDTDWTSNLSSDSIKQPHRFLQMKGLAYMIYTSGSTGRPKGATNTHEAILNRLLWMQQEYELDHTDCVLQKTPFSFDVSVWEFFWPLMVGSKLLVAEPGGHRDTNYLIDLIRRNEVTTLHFVPPMLQAFVEDPDVTSCSPLRRVICSGEALPGDLRDRFIRLLDCDLHNLYGPTEAAIDVSFWDCHKETENPAIPIGHPISNTQLPILDTNFEPLPAGAPGELMIGGINLARGYHARPDLTADRFIPNVFATQDSAGSRLYRTGDLTKFRSNGCIDFLGRLDNQVKIRGLRIELGEIETVFGSHPQIQETVVLVREDRPGLRRIVAYLVAPTIDPNNEQAFSDELQTFSGIKLPDYMIPKAFIFMDTLPLTPNGKIDRRALPAPATSHDSDSLPSFRPLTQVESQLASIWSSLLGVKTIAPNDNFFHLGGDSIQSIQVVSRARSSGLILTVRDLFEGQTLEAIAARTTQSVVSRVDQGPISGSVELTPIQRWFSLLPIKNRDHWNQGIVLRLGDNTDLKLVNRALEQLCFHHDQLRARFEFRDGSIDQKIDSVNAPVVISGGNHASEASSELAIQQAMQQSHESLDPESGPIFAATHLSDRDTKQSWLLIVAHHLVVDGVSWRILIEDLSSAYDQQKEGQAIKLPNKTVSYQDWASQINSEDSIQEARKDLEYWKARSGPSPTTHQGLSSDLAQTTSSLERQAITKRIEIPTPTSQFISKDLTNRSNLRIHEFLIAALSQAWQNVTGTDRFTLDIEGHGRSIPSREDLDVSRTVGWFTSIYPVTIQSCANATSIQFLASVRNTIAKIPSDGISYGILRSAGLIDTKPTSEILFNYLGQLESNKQDGLIAGMESIENVFARDPESSRPYPIDISAVISDGQLVIHWTHDNTAKAKSRSESLASEFVKAIETLAAACQSLENKIRVPSDFPLTKLSPGDLASLEKRMSDFEDVLPLTPMQAGILFHTQFSTDSGSYIQQLGFTLQGNLVGDRLKEAWQRTLKNHTSLRSFFVIDELESPFQLIARDTTAPWLDLDWSELSPNEFSDKLERHMTEDRQRGIDVSAPPLMRFHLIRKRVGESILLWTHHHLLLDGWSIPLIVNEVLQYHNQVEGASLRTTAPRQFKDYLRWLNLQDTKEATDFWKGELDQYKQPTRLPFTSSPLNTGQSTATNEIKSSLSPLLTGALKTLAKKEHVTMSCLAQAGWATLMAAANPDQPVVFGATVSGRPANLDGVEAIVGLFINTIPICVHTNTQETTLEWLRSIHTKQADRERFSFIPLSQLNHLSSLPTRSPLFESVLVYENFPIEQQSSKNPETLSVSGVVVRERTSFPLTLIIGESDQWHLRLLFDENRISESAAKAILEGFSKIMESLFSYTDRPAIEFVRDHHALSDQTSLERSSFTHTTEAGEPVSITPPSTSFPSESILHEVWASVLGVSKIKPHDDFFDLGGDSILSLQIVSRLSKQGLKISVKDVFEHPTIHSLAKRLTSESTPLVDQDPVTGQIELSPIQHWFFSLQHENPSHWNQSLLFELADVLDEHALEQAIQKLIKHHDVLRGIFPTSSVKRPQTFTILESTDQHHLHRVNLEEGLSDNERAAQIQEHCDFAQQSLKIDQGQLIRFVFIKTGSATRDRLLIVSHHLVIDGVSWRILIDDLNLAYEQIARGRQTAALPPRTNSYKDWSLFTHSNSTKIAAVESSYWNSILSETMGQGTPSLTLREKSGDNREIDTIHQQEELTESETETLSHLAASGSLGNVENLLIAALAQAAFSTLPGKNLLIDLESHGRSNNECPLDLSRTIGWFTAIYPISLNRISEGGTLNYASHVHDRKQAIPQDGSGYGSLRFLEPESISDQVVFQSEILFNYLGRTSSQLSENAFFRPVDEPSGQTRSPITNRSHLLSVDCIIRNGRLRLDFGYSPQSTSEETMKRLMVNFIIAIREFASSDHSAPATLTPDTSMIEDDMLDDILDELED